MKKFLSVSAMALVLLAGCSSGPVNYAGEGAPSTEENHEGEIATATYTKEGDDITAVDFDVLLSDGTSKTAYSESGEYGMAANGGREWHEHVADLEAYVVENDAFPTLDAEGKDADAVSGSTITISMFEEAFNNAVEVTE